MAGETTLGIAQIPIRATLDELDKDLSAARAKFDDVLRPIQDLGKLALGGVAAGLAGIAAGLGAGIKGAMEEEVVFANLEATLKSTGATAKGITFDSLVKLGDQLSLTTRYTHEQINEADAMLLTFTNIGKNVLPEATVAVANLGEKFGSIQSASIQVGKALQDPISGVTALRRVGVMLSDQQEEQIKRFMDLGDIESAQRIILKELETEFGGLAVSMGKTASGSLTILKHSFDEMLETVGANFLPIISALAKQAMPMLDKALKAVAPIAKLVGESLGTFFNNIMMGINPITALQVLLTQLLPPEISSTIMGIVTAVQAFLISIQPTIDQIMAWIGQNVELQDVLIALGVAIAAVVIPAIISVVAAAAPIIVAFLAIVAVAALLRQAWTENWGGIRDTLTQFWEGTAKPALTALWNWLSVNVPAAIKTLATFWNETLLPALREVLGFLNEFVIPGFKAVANVVSAVVGKAVEALAGLWQNVLKKALKEVWEFIDGPLGSVLKWLGENILPKIKEVFGAIGDAIKTLQGGLNTLAESIRGMKLPAWLTPGSPTPLELGLIGISEAVQQASDSLNAMLASGSRFGGRGLNMSARLEAMPELAGLGNGGSSDTYNQQQTRTTINVNDPLTGALVMRMFQQQERGRLNARMG